MKRQLSVLAGLLLSMTILAQNKVNLVVFSEDSEPFYTYVNGVRQNDKAETNVKITGLTPNISLRIVFENKALPEIKQSMALEAGFEHTARLKKDNKQQMKLRYFGQVPLEESASNVPSVAYHSAENPAPSQNTASSGHGDSHTTVTTSTTTTSRSANGNENVNVNVNMAGVGISMNVTGMEPNGSATMNSTTSTTMTSSSSSSGSYSSHDENSAVASTPPAASKSGCSTAISPSSFSTMKKSVESKPFSDTKMSTAKVATKNSCLTIEQVKEICKLFSMDDDKLTYAKYAYAYCLDRPNYYQVGDVFSFSTTTDEFNKFLEK